MKIKLDNGDRRRVSSYKDSAFIDCSDINNGMSISVEFYGMHHLQLRKKDRFYKLFIFENIQSAEDFDFGYWSDGEVIEL